MNQDQLMGILRMAVPTGVAYFVGKGWIPAGAAGDIGTAVIAVASGFWSYKAHTDSAKIAAVTALPDVKKIITAPYPSNPDVKDASLDSSQPKVTPAT